MKKFFSKSFAIAIALMAVSSIVSAAELTANWKDGLVFKSEDKAFKIKLGGRLQTDFAFQSADSALEDEFGKFEDGTEIRRAYVELKGTIYSDVFYAIELDVSKDEVEPQSALIGVNLGGVKVMAGHIKEPFSLENLTSNKYVTFMERSLPTIFAPGYNMGLAVAGTAFDKEMTWSVGAFRDTDAQGKDEGGNWNVTGRVTGLVYDADDANFVHLGVAASYRDPDDDAVSYKQRPEVHLSHKLVAASIEDAKTNTLFGAELAWVMDSFSLQGEYMLANVDSKEAGDPTLQGFYVYASYFLTGESRPYKKSAGKFDRVKPISNFLGEDGGIGAWELAVRYSFLDFEDKNITGGELGDVTVGVNWYLNPNTAVKMNYVYADLDGVGSANIFQTRFQIDF